MTPFAQKTHKRGNLEIKYKQIQASNILTPILAYEMSRYLVFQTEYLICYAIYETNSRNVIKFTQFSNDLQ